MSVTLRVFLVILIFIQLLLITHKIKQKKLTMRYASLWIVFLLTLIFLSIFPDIIIFFAQFLGFEASSNMVFLIGFFIVSYICFILSISISKQNEKMKGLIQEVSLLKKKVNDCDERK